MRPRQINLRRHPQSPDTPLVHPLNSINDSLASFPRQIDRRSSIQRHNIERKFLASIIYVRSINSNDNRKELFYLNKAISLIR